MATDERFAELTCALHELTTHELVIARIMIGGWIRNRTAAKMEATLNAAEAKRKARRKKGAAAPAGVTDADHSDATAHTVSHVDDTSRMP